MSPQKSSCGDNWDVIFMREIVARTKFRIRTREPKAIFYGPVSKLQNSLFVKTYLFWPITKLSVFKLCFTLALITISSSLFFTDARFKYPYFFKHLLLFACVSFVAGCLVIFKGSATSLNPLKYSTVQRQMVNIEVTIKASETQANT